MDTNIQAPNAAAGAPTCVTSNELNRRGLLGTVAVGAVVGMGMGGVTTCGSVDISGFIAQFNNLINQIQQGVRTAQLAVCSVVNSLVPNIDTAIAAIENILGSVLNSVNIGGITAAQIASAIQLIVKMGCPPAPPSGSVAAVPNVTIKNGSGKDIPVVYIS